MNKIAVLAPEIHEPFIEGIQKNAWSISQALTQSEATVSVFTQCSYGQKINDANIKINYSLNAKRCKLIKYFSWLKNGFKISREIRKDNSDLLLVFSLDWSFILPIFWTAIISPKTKIRLVCFSLRELTGINAIFFNLLRNKFDHIFPRSNHLKEKLVSLGFNSEKISVVTALPNKEKFAIATPELSNTETINRIAYLSSAEETAGVYLIPNLAQALPEITFTLALRQFSEREEVDIVNLEKELKKKNLNNLIITRNIKNITEFYQSQDAIILPPKDERNTMSAPLVLLEAFLLKKPTFLSNLGIFSEYEDFSFIFRETDDLIKTIKEINQSPNKIILKTQSAYEYVKQLPDATTAAKIYQS